MVELEKFVAPVLFFTTGRVVRISPSSVVSNSKFGRCELKFKKLLIEVCLVSSFRFCS
ncbi:hypothetical protein M3Y94_00636100 [Aphelenchoides besseyi]|nr:hypothetical protein M3Y94_00636100 [Aphelenchoides besseyi]